MTRYAKNALFTDDDLPPGPYEYQTTALPGEHDGKGHVYIVDTNGRRIASIWGPHRSKMALAELIIEASKRQEEPKR